MGPFGGFDGSNRTPKAEKRQLSRAGQVFHRRPMNFRFSLFAALALVNAAAPYTHAQQIAVRELAPPRATSTEGFGAILNLRAMSDGSVLVNDGGSRQLVLLNNKLVRLTMALDSGKLAGATGYGPSASALIPYTGDSSLF